MMAIRPLYRMKVTAAFRMARLAMFTVPRPRSFTFTPTSQAVKRQLMTSRNQEPVCSYKGKLFSRTMPVPYKRNNRTPTWMRMSPTSVGNL